MPGDRRGIRVNRWYRGARSVAEPGRAFLFNRDVVIIGGCGHVGLPLAVALAARGATVACYDISAEAVAAVGAGVPPFREPGIELALQSAVAAGRLTATTNPAVIGGAEHVIVTVDGPVERSLASCSRYFGDGQLLVLRSTVPPGGTARLEKLTADLGIDADVAFCPERIAEGQAMTELAELPQIISSRTERGLDRAARLFLRLTPALVPMSPEEAELAKLFSNAWRYISFAAANQLYAIANDRGLDYDRIRRGMLIDYPRATGLPAAGFAAGPCLPKDTIELIETSAGFTLGRAAVAANEGLADYVVARLARRYDLASACVGILGMAFKAGTDDIRASLSYRLRRQLADRARQVLCTDPWVRSDPELVPLAAVLARSDLLVVGAPHPEYRRLETDLPVADLWGVTGRGVLI
jgi:UDP-N-acetyl-D-mannosaminuronic acid dehydrogenase